MDSGLNTNIFKNCAHFNMEKNSVILVAGGFGLVGSALVRELREQGYEKVIVSGRKEADLTDPIATKWYFSVHRPEYVFLCAARVGGIKDHIKNPLSFFLDNMAIETNVLRNAVEYDVRKLVFLGSSCIYPRLCNQPIKEEYLLTGSYDKATEAYGLAKTCGVRLCEWFSAAGHNFVSAMPCNVFGKNDFYNEVTGHVIPGLLTKFHHAKLENASTFSVWGDGSQKREFIFSDDLAIALILVMKYYNGPGHINTGSGYELSIESLAHLIACVVGYEGQILFDAEQPIGTPRKLMDNSKLKQLGWLPKWDFRAALSITYEDMLKNPNTRK